MAEYLQLCAPLTAPTPAQIEAFALYIADMHSWYKHLPLTPPGSPFVVFIDPGAGYQLFEHADGRFSYSEVGANANQFHYSMMSTADYRARFGCLNVRQSHSPSFRLVNSEGSAYFGDVPGVFAGSDFRAIPEPLAQLGHVELTGSIHSMASLNFLWERVFWRKQDDHAPELLQWPAESGGVAVLADIQRLLLMQDRYTFDEINQQLAELIAPERERQLRQLRLSAAQVVESVFQVAG
jgi:hypothetical protein